jgi:hypothetical protein
MSVVHRSKTHLLWEEINSIEESLATIVPDKLIHAFFFRTIPFLKRTLRMVRLKKIIRILEGYKQALQSLVLYDNINRYYSLH